MLVVAGTFFESIESYRARVDELGIRDSVRLFDEYIPNEDVASLFAMSDLVVLPYRSASQSGVIPLAAMFRKPVVTTNVGGLPEALAGSGVVVPPNDPDALGVAVVGRFQSRRRRRRAATICGVAGETLSSLPDKVRRVRLSVLVVTFNRPDDLLDLFRASHAGGTRRMRSRRS